MVFVNYFIPFSGDSAHYTLVGDGYIVQVNQKQFDEFGTGEFADLDLDRFAEHYGLGKDFPRR